MHRKLLAALLVVLPAVAVAQPQVVRTVDFITPPGTPVFGVAHVEDLRNGDRRQFHIAVSTAEGSADLTFDGRTLRLGDGTTIVSEVLANTRGAFVLRVTASTEAGSSESAILVQNRQTGETSVVGAERYALLLSGSRDARIAHQILSLVTSAPRGSGGLSAKVGEFDCLIACMNEMTALFGMAYGCSTGNLLGCLGAVSAAITQANAMYNSCGLVSYDDGTIGWL